MQLDFVTTSHSPFGPSSSASAHLDLSLQQKLSFMPPSEPLDETESLPEECFFLFEEEEEIEETLGALELTNSECDEKEFSISRQKSKGIDVSSSRSTESLNLMIPVSYMDDSGLDSSFSSTSFKEGAASQPIDITCCRNNQSRRRLHRRSRKKLSSVRESLLAEAWERKRGLMLYGHAKPLQRSVSDCVNSQGCSKEFTRGRARARSLTDDDFDELRGCIDLGFGFDESSIPNLCETLPALEVYYAVTQKLHDSPRCMSPVSQTNQSPPSSSTPSWKVASPGDDPKDVKGRLRHWAQAVACNVRLCL